MRPFRLLPLVLLALAGSADAALAQNFFERLFGLVPARPAPPPVTYQNVPAPDGLNPLEEPRRPIGPPVQARPVALPIPTEAGIIGRDLKQNGSGGTIRIDRTARGDLTARLTMIGRRSAQSVETCSVSLGGTTGIALVSQGRPDGVARYQLPDPTCPLQIDVLDESVLIRGSGDACVFQSANCQAEPTALWGPEPSTLIPRARDLEAARAAADKAVRENYKVLVQRARPEGVRPIVAEQAGFSAEREVLCRTYAREGSHSFCDARYSEARAIALAQRIGVTVASAAPLGTPAEIRPRRRDPYAVPQTDDVTQRNGGVPDDD